MSQAPSVQMPIEIPQDETLPIGDVTAPPRDYRSSGPGSGGGIGTGRGTGIGSGSGPGVGPGSGGGMGRRFGRRDWERCGSVCDGQRRNSAGRDISTSSTVHRGGQEEPR